MRDLLDNGQSSKDTFVQPSPQFPSGTPKDTDNSSNILSDIKQQSPSNPSFIDEQPNDTYIDDIEDETTDVIIMFKQLLGLQNNAAKYKAYGRKIDQIRLLLTNSNTEIARIGEYFELLPVDSTESYLIVSVLQGLPDDKGKDALIRIAERALTSGDENGPAQFLEIVGRTGIVTPEITRSLKEMALYTENTDQSLYALDMLMPFQLSRSENQQILTRLEEINESVEDQGYKNYLFNQIIRFSDNQKRSQIAYDRLYDPDSTIENKAIVLDYFEQGQIDKTPEVREILIQMAQEMNSPLQMQSIKVLMSSFNLTQDEYQLLVEDQGITPFNLR